MWKTGAITLVQWGLMAGCQADKMLVHLKILKVLEINKTLKI